MKLVITRTILFPELWQIIPLPIGIVLIKSLKNIYPGSQNLCCLIFHKLKGCSYVKSTSQMYKFQSKNWERRAAEIKISCTNANSNKNQKINKVLPTSRSTTVTIWTAVYHVRTTYSFWKGAASILTTAKFATCISSRTLRHTIRAHYVWYL